MFLCPDAPCIITDITQFQRLAVTVLNDDCCKENGKIYRMSLHQI